MSENIIIVVIQDINIISKTMEVTAPLYPIGIKDFVKFRSNGYTYVDKTKYIFDLVNFHGIVFLSRPRRFGKSLVLSTLQTFFEGRREYFKGLAIDFLPVDWDVYPVLHFQCQGL